MTSSLPQLGSWLQRRAENFAAALLAIMFGAFMIQIIFRYLFNFPIGWTSELTIVTWVWIVLWGAAFVVREREEIRFDLLYAAVNRPTRRIFCIVSAIALIGIYGYSMPATVDYVTFMKVQSTTYLRIRYDHLFSIYLVFGGAIIARYIWILWQALRNKSSGFLDPPASSSGL